MIEWYVHGNVNSISTKRLAIYGYGGHAREVAAHIGKEVTFFVDEQYATEKAKSIKEFDPAEFSLMIAVADSKARKTIVEKLPKETEFFTFIHHTAQILSHDIIIGKGSFIGAYSVLTTNIEIGNHAILNRGNHIGHDSLIGDFFSAMPCAVLGGNTKIGDCVYVGSGAHVKEKVSITDNVIVGMQAAVVKNITQQGTYVGVPCKRLENKNV